jgi:hypothetical protein
MRVYIAGPMSNLPQFNFPAFYAAAAELRTQGFEVVSPAELDDAEDKGAALLSKDGDPKSASRTWGDFLARDVKLLADTGIEGIVFLPGWHKSKGAKLEAFVGLLQGFQFWIYDDRQARAWPVDQDSVRRAIDRQLKSALKVAQEATA